MKDTTIRLIIICVSALGLLSGILGAVLMWKGYQTGDLFAGGMTSSIAGLLGMLSQQHKSDPASPAGAPGPGVAGADTSSSTNVPSPGSSTTHDTGATP